VAVLAIDGGEPVRRAPLPGAYPGATAFGVEEIEAVEQVLNRRSPFRYYGPDVAHTAAALEHAFAERLGVQYATAVSSGTAALVVALRALGVGPGAEVILPPSTFIGCANAIVAAGAVPVFADVDDDLQLSPAGVAAAISPRTRAIMVVHWRGLAVPLQPILDIADSHGIPVIEDCAQSLGARDDDREIGGRGRIGVFSFQMNKVLTAGEGGMVVTDDATLAARAVALHDNGTAPRGEQQLPDVPELFGENYRLTEVAAAILQAQLRKLGAVRQQLREICGSIGAAAEECSGVRLRKRAGTEADVGASAILIFASAELAVQARAALAAEGVPMTVPYGGRPIYLRDVFQHRRLWHAGAGPWHPAIYDGAASYSVGTCPVAEAILPRAAQYTLSLDWGQQDAADVGRALIKVMTALDPSARAAG
jgi:8-amino-3,8-dideoxy-alpha-D-manno-octulosonate transaminase